MPALGLRSPQGFVGPGALAGGLTRQGGLFLGLDQAPAGLLLLSGEQDLKAQVRQLTQGEDGFRQGRTFGEGGEQEG